MLVSRSTAQPSLARVYVLLFNYGNPYGQSLHLFVPCLPSYLHI